MKAAIRRIYGTYQNLKVETVPGPVARDHEVLVAVYASTVNRTDCAILTGRPFIMRFFTGFIRPTLPIPGTDFAGRIAAVGKSVTAYKVGDRVFGFNDLGLSSQAEYMVMPGDGAMALIPDNVAYAEAASSVEGAHYAFNIINKVEVKPGKKVLVNGASGAIGSALLQLLKYYDINVTAVCGTRNIELIKLLGADKVYDYLLDDFTKDEDYYDFVFDAVGKSTFAKCKAILKPGGTYISSELGPMGQNLFLPVITKFLSSRKVIFPVPTNIKRTIALIKKLLEERKFMPVIDRTYPLDEISAAYKYVASGQKTGNVVVILRDV